MSDPKRPDQLTALPLPVTKTDRMVVGRANDLYRHDFPAWRGHNSDRKIVTKPTASLFATWVNQDGASLTDIDDGFYITRAAKGSGDSLNCALRALSGSAWDVKLGVVCGWPAKQFNIGGLVVRDSASGKLATWGPGHGDAGPIFVLWSSPTSFNQTPYNPSSMGGSSTNMGWFRLRKNGTAIECYWSPDGTDWFLEFSMTLGTLGSPSSFDQWGVFMSGNNNSTPNTVVRCDFIDWGE